MLYLDQMYAEHILKTQNIPSYLPNGVNAQIVNKQGLTHLGEDIGPAGNEYERNLEIYEVFTIQECIQKLCPEPYLKRTMPHTVLNYKRRDIPSSPPLCHNIRRVT